MLHIDNDALTSFPVAISRAVNTTPDALKKNI